jgi:hypothetical protein
MAEHAVVTITVPDNAAVRAATADDARREITHPDHTESVGGFSEDAKAGRANIGFDRIG